MLDTLPRRTAAEIPEIRRTRDAQYINALANDPSIRPWLGLIKMGALDLTPLIDDENVFLDVGGRGAFILLHTPPHGFEWHTMMREGARGKFAVLAALAAQDWIFTQTDAPRLTTFVPSTNRAARVFAHAIGFEETHRKDGTAAMGEPCEFSMREITRTQWMANRTSEGNACQ